MTDITPLDYGWKLSDDHARLTIKWFEGEQIPADIENSVEIEDESDDEYVQYEPDDEYDSDTEY